MVMLVGVSSPPLLCCDVIDLLAAGNFVLCLPVLSVRAAGGRYNLFTVLFCDYILSLTPD
jgi:hypothetical protein